MKTRISIRIWKERNYNINLKQAAPTASLECKRRPLIKQISALVSVVAVIATLTGCATRIASSADSPGASKGPYASNQVLGLTPKPGVPGTSNLMFDPRRFPMQSLESRLVKNRQMAVRAR